jgi:hypothetical protein
MKQVAFHIVEAAPGIMALGRHDDSAWWVSFDHAELPYDSIDAESLIRDDLWIRIDTTPRVVKPWQTADHRVYATTKWLRHLDYQHQDQAGVDRRSRVAVAYDCGEFRVKTLRGPVPRAEYLRHILTAAMEAAMPTSDFIDVVRHFHALRRYAWRVEVTQSAYGARGYWVRYARDPAMGDFPRGGGISVSGAGKLRAGLRVWAGDLIVMRRLEQDFQPAAGEIIGVSDPSVDGADFIDPQTTVWEVSPLLM